GAGGCGPRGGVTPGRDGRWGKPGGGRAGRAGVRSEPEAGALLSAAHSPGEFVALLAEQGHATDAARFAAFALPRRAAVWWACLCVRQALSQDAATPAREALHAAERWVVEPSERHRRAALRAAEAAEFGTAAGCCP